MNVNDKVSMEYESRVMIDESQYLEIKAKYLNSGRVCREFTNKNIYLDTPDLYLTRHHVVLRIREIDDELREITLKTKGNFGDTEMNHIIEDDIEYNNILKGIIEDKNITFGLRCTNVDINKLGIVGELVTERVEVEYDDYMLVIDKNYYNNKIDYNLEVESTSVEKAEEYMKKIIAPYKLEIKKDYKGKSTRAIFKL